FLIISYRDGQPLDTMIRDMQILVEDCRNDPPELIKDVEEICVVAGEFIEFPVTATAPLTDMDQRVRLTASGGPFLVPTSAATFEPISLIGFAEDPLTRTFRWQTTCDHISSQPYFVVFRAEDDFFGDDSGLSTIQTVSIKVVAPPPQLVLAEESTDFVTISWELPYFCETLTDPEFEGFTVWRRLGSNNFPIDTCETGLEGRGYEEITSSPVQEMDGGRYVFFDDDVDRGRTYCYRVLAEFSRRTPISNLIIERLESIPSEEVCVQLPRDIPLLTKVDVTETDPANGGIDVCWIRPDAAELDTILNPPPYRYVLSRALGFSPPESDFQEIASFEVDAFSDPVDTCFSDTGLNTTDEVYSYRIEFFTGNQSDPLEDGIPASSVRIGAVPTDNAVDLSWQANVPWTNTEFTLFRKLPGATEFDSLTTITTTSFQDTELTNGLEYCYFVRTSGSYGVDGIPTPLLNRSQEICTVPIDNVPPCPPVLSVSSICDRGGDCNQPDNLFNDLSWESPELICDADDVAGFRVYYATGPDATPQLVADLESPTLLDFEHTPPSGIVGCYYVTAYDFNDNESELSNQVCVTNCPFYELPNAFTPNADNQNDLFVPRGLCFVERVQFQVFNRWGQVVFETEDPALNWDGKNTSGAELASGTYYYVCRIFERR
ncbi:MAG: gliding motility-associated C-terminal domain-containing protein, partial [Bacteroidota bacterium]